ncbi:Z1 domain-containing protein [Nocardioides speluncae]|uniref:Z1 domain-containing protein n=1 Tax=Nocardioides speluncae TaxID=2670337 RepID=UPI00137A34CA|nr:Z1 domain-containing protein [Nocardioides speluncae]
MTSAGERIDKHVRMVRLLMSDGLTLDDALGAAAHLIPAEDHEAVRRAYTQQTSTTIQVLEPGVLAEGGPRAWFDDHNPAGGYYWRRQRELLAHDLRRQEFEIDSLDKATNRILSHLEDPKSDDGFAIRGLVIGHVQSGKTQNFSALIAKAADAGYKIVIVLSGLHNSLRRQTQLRLERDLGRENVKGVGEPEAGKRWQWMTGPGLWEDFAKSGVNAAVLQGNEQVILVVKKNKSRLEWLNEWMKDRVPKDVAVLVIDDEADQASINTGGNRFGEVPAEVGFEDQVDLVGDGRDFDGGAPAADELSPSAINKNIRILINRFDKCAYVAYTATPFANVLIDPDAFDRAAGGDLYPRHFIINLPDPPGDLYVGSVRLFGRDAISGEAGTLDEDGLDVVEFVSDKDLALIVPPPRQRAGFVPTVPPSLKLALADYVLASAALVHRAGRDEPCTMLIHTDMQRAMQNQLAPDVGKELAYIRQRWLYEARDYRPQLAERWTASFMRVTAGMDISRVATFAEIEPHIDRLLRDGIDIRVLNSDHADELDFDAEPTLKAVLIGGNKLSRGLTIEGLLVSFYVRSTLYYDTLLQMARWFGYRGRYVDLTRLYSTKALVSYFHDLATAEADLRSQVSRYERDRLTPTDFVVRVRKHSVMKVTQPSKMRDAEENNLSYSGELIQTLRVPEALPTGNLRETDRQTILANLEATRSLFERLGVPEDPAAAKPTWVNVEPANVIEFLRTFSIAQERKFDVTSLVDYIQAQAKMGELVRWQVLLACGSSASPDPSFSENLGVAGRESVPLISRTRMKQDPTSMGVVTDPGDELIGLTEAALAAAQERYREFPGVALSIRQREQRDPTEGLLMIYPISPAAEPDARRARNRVRLFEKPEDVPTIVQYAISFPFSKSDATVEYLSAPSPGAPR